MQIRDSLGNLLGVTGNPLIVETPEESTFLGAYQAEVTGTIAASGQTANTGGFFWAFNPVTSGVLVRLERISIQVGLTTAVAAGFPTAPRLAISRFTYTGTPSGAAVAGSGTGSTVGKFDSNYPANVFDWRSAITGATCSYLQTLSSVMAPAIAIVGTVTTSQIAGAMSDNVYQPRETEYEHVVRPGEGIVVWQPEAGSTSDTRKFVSRVFWEEVTVP